MITEDTNVLADLLQPGPKKRLAGALLLNQPSEAMALMQPLRYSYWPERTGDF